MIDYYVNFTNTITINFYPIKILLKVNLIGIREYNKYLIR